MDAVRAMGSKIESKKMMAAAGVPVLDELDPDTVTAGQLPVLVKASSGGGGRGMRVVDELDALPSEVAAAQREAQSAFGDPTVFCERYLPTGHHVEVQVMADAHGTVWAVGERECSIQRRHQKIIEEAPSPLVERIPGMRARLFDAARLAAGAIGYTGAGTVEFLADDDGEFYFLEMNTRLQVEHPVTEETTGLDLVELQLAVADGGRLDAEPPAAHGHSIEARLYAEDPAQDWQPQAGLVHTHRRAGGPDRVQHARGANRDPAGLRHRRRLGGLDPLRPDAGQGDLLRSDAPPGGAGARRRAGPQPSCTACAPTAICWSTCCGIRRSWTAPPTPRSSTPTAWRSCPRRWPTTPTIRLSAIAAALADAAHNRATATVLGSIPSGWRNLASGYQVKTYRRRRRRRASRRIPFHPNRIATARRRVGTAGLGDGRRGRAGRRPRGGAQLRGGTRYGPDVYVDSARGPVHLVALPRFPEPGSAVEKGSLVAPMPGNVIRLGAAVGDTVTAGQPLIWLEAMKMEHTITAPADGVLAELNVDTGHQVEVGAVLARVDAPHDPEAEGDSQ